MVLSPDPVAWLEEASPLPAVFPSPFGPLGPHPIVHGAVRALHDELRGLELQEGKMFGVLLVQSPEGRVGFLRAFSGMLEGAWTREGHCPPLFDPVQRAAIELPGEQQISELTRRLQEHLASDALRDARSAVERCRAAHHEALAALDREHALRREDRHRRRAALPPDSPGRKALDDESRRDKADRRRQIASHVAERSSREGALRRLERRGAALERLRAWASRGLMKALHDTYRVRSFRGEERPLRSLYGGAEPPSGAGDCCGPKLLGAAQRLGLRPLAMAELWWGPPPPTGGRVQGAFYPACRAKCGPLLPFMLEGVDVAPPRQFELPAHAERRLDLVFEDAALVVIDKPEGLLSIPAKGGRQDDSVLTRVRAQFPASGPMIVHRLDLDTSGLMVVALNADAYASLQRQFLRREVFKRYEAVLAGSPPGDSGRIQLALRVDLEDRPRQIHDPVHGRAAITDWRVLERLSGRTRVSLFPLTGRTHQLRAHAAHPLGLNAPIVGDRLYGFEAQRLLLHASALGFRHPVSEEPLRFESPVPF